jgi:hypothetical protein
MKNMRSKFLACAAALALSLEPVAAQQLQDGATVLGHLLTGSAPPVLSACGTTPALANGSTDFAGTITMGTTATGCVLTFAKAFLTAPHCIVDWQATPLASQSFTVSTTALTLTQTSTTNNVASYLCIGKPGN